MNPDYPNIAIIHYLGSFFNSGLTEWIRYPYYETEELDNGWQVIIRDLRYVTPDQVEADGIGLAVVELDQNLQPISK